MGLLGCSVISKSHFLSLHPLHPQIPWSLNCEDGGLSLTTLLFL